MSKVKFLKNISFPYQVVLKMEDGRVKVKTRKELINKLQEIVTGRWFLVFDGECLSYSKPVDESPFGDNYEYSDPVITVKNAVIVFFENEEDATAFNLILDRT